MSEPLRVLLVEDSPTDAKLILRELRHLRQAVSSERVQNADELRRVLAEQAWDVLISDWTLPTFSGADALAIVAESGLDVPFIIVSGSIGEEAAVDAMRAGAHDYVLKDNLTRLVPAIEREVAEAASRAARRTAEHALRASDQRFRRMVEMASVGVSLLDADYRTVFINDRMLQMAGRSANEVVGKSVVELTAGTARADLERHFETRRSGVPESYEHEHRRPDGSSVWALVESKPLFDPRGQFDGVLTIAVDITERKRANEALRRSEARLSRLSESGIIGISVADLQGNQFEANDAYLRMLGYTREEFETRHPRWDDLTPTEWADTDRVAVEQLKARGMAFPWEKELFRKDGSRIPVLVGVAMLDESKCIAVLADLTQRKRTEAALKTAEAQVKQAQKMEAVGLLAGGIAHDFNNILSVILSYSALVIAELRDGDPIREDLEEVRNAARRAADLTRQLLTFSRQQVLEPKILDLNDVVAGMDKMLRRILGEDIELVLIPGAPLDRVKADAGSIEQVIMNLVVNARDAMPTGGRLAVETRNVDVDQTFADAHPGVRPGPHVMLAVSDTGAGMDAATLVRIFEPFFTTKEMGKGTGLGLSTSLGIVQQSGGAIWAYSEPRAGTTFKVFLPRAAGGSSEVEPAPARAQPTKGNECILLVEDNDQLRKVTATILRRGGYQVIECVNGGDGVLGCERTSGEIHLLLTDVVMPDMSGPELAKRLQPLRPGMRVLFMSGYTNDMVLRHGVSESAVAFLQKPFTPLSLTQKVREVLDQARP